MHNFNHYLKQVNEKSFKDFPFELHYTADHMRSGKGFKSIQLALQYATSTPGISEWSLFKNGSGFHSTTQEEFLIYWYDKGGDYWSNRSVKEPALLAKKYNKPVNTVTTEAVGELQQVQAGEVIKLQKPAPETFVNKKINNDSVEIADCTVCGADGVLVQDHICKTVVDTSVIDNHDVVDESNGTDLRVLRQDMLDDLDTSFMFYIEKKTNKRKMLSEATLPEVIDYIKKYVFEPGRWNFFQSPVYSVIRAVISLHLNIPQQDVYFKPYLKECEPELSKVLQRDMDFLQGLIDQSGGVDEFQMKRLEEYKKRIIVESTSDPLEFIYTTVLNCQDEDWKVKLLSYCGIGSDKYAATHEYPTDKELANALTTYHDHIISSLHSPEVFAKVDVMIKNGQTPMDYLNSNHFESLRTKYGVNESKMLTKIEWFKNIVLNK